MRKNESVLDRKVSVRGLGNLVGGSILVAVVAGVLWHRQAIKRLVEISRM
jgi:formate/nitrite transporter FocA (FNT family)